MRLDQAYEAIMDAVANSLDAARSGLLDDVTAIIRGDRARPRPSTPSIWVFAETLTPSHAQTTIQESWTLPVVLAAIVKSDTPEAGYRKASSLAARARSVVLADRVLGLRQLVQDTKSARFEPGGPWHQEGNLYSAVAVVQVTFRINEGGNK